MVLKKQIITIIFNNTQAHLEQELQSNNIFLESATQVYNLKVLKTDNNAIIFYESKP